MPTRARDLTDPDWKRPYSREAAVFPTPATHDAKFWPNVNRIDNVYGDRHFVCACPPPESYLEDEAELSAADN